MMEICNIKLDDRSPLQITGLKIASGVVENKDLLLCWQCRRGVFHPREHLHINAFVSGRAYVWQISYYSNAGFMQAHISSRDLKPDIAALQTCDKSQQRQFPTTFLSKPYNSISYNRKRSSESLTRIK